MTTIYSIQDRKTGEWYKPAYLTSRRWQADVTRAKVYQRLGFAKSAVTGIREREPGREPEIKVVGTITVVRP